MTAADWYRNKQWNEKIETHFFDNLSRARNQKAQYLRIQAHTLISVRPDVSLTLLEEYFNTGDTFDLAQAYVDQAAAYEVLNNIPQAVEAYKNAISREKMLPSVQTRAYLELPLFAATHNLENLYPDCLSILDNHKDRLT
ncbi:MAG: hypothetical protein AB7F82_02645, partial [Alphaproteobacteria bacterium]